jgi:predicted O-methyltransferase YrrM
MSEPPEEWREQLERALVGVEGWLAFDEAWALHESARLGPSSSVAEIGSHKGRSTIALALGLEARGCGKVLAIDPYDAEIDGESGDARRAVFQANLRRAGVAHRVEQCRSYSHEAAEHVAAMSLGALFVDGSHEYGDVIQDIDDWLPKMAGGALVLFNDLAIAPVSWALRDRVATRGSPLRQASRTTNTLVTRYWPGEPWTARDEARRLRLRAVLPFAWRYAKLIDRLGGGGAGAKLGAKIAFKSGGLALSVLLPKANIQSASPASSSD